MACVVFITGPAGSGKTTRLLHETSIMAQSKSLRLEQKVLAMAYMHGARKRMEASFSETPSCVQLPRRITTIDGFSLDLLNRWRTALGFTWPFVPTYGNGESPPCVRDFRTYATFDQINLRSAELLGTPTIAKLIAASYPIVLVDEFQDCWGPRLDVVRALSKITQVIVAADGFQVLDDIQGCPALDWVETLEDVECERHSLTGSHRTTQTPILNAARALRENARVADETVPIFYGRPAQLVYKIMERITTWAGWIGKWNGQFALIAPTHKALAEVMAALDHQCQRKNLPSVRWTRTEGSDQERNELFTALGIDENLDDSFDFVPADGDSRLRAEDVVMRARRFARLRGLQILPKRLVAHFAESGLHASRAYGHRSSFRTAATVHGAKNREFENVVVVWPYGVTGSAEKQRRLLYNAITRAKSNCIVLDLRKASDVENDAVLRLLGNAKPAFPPKQKSAKKRNTSRSTAARIPPHGPNPE
jgi:superfamily I DNA/RNA helicase